jgi:hypothetical protein
MMRITALAVCGMVATLVGCGQSVQHATLGRQFVLTEEPSEILGIVDYHEAETKPTDVSLIGRIGFKNLKWSTQSAMFLLVDPAEALEGGGHVCHDENCPFCKGKKGPNTSQAIVMLVGEDGQVPPIDARKLLPLEEGQTAVVSGRAEIDAAGQLVLHARGIYVRR